MRLALILLCLGLQLATLNSAEAAKRQSSKAKKAPQASLSTNHNFDDHGVRGEYKMPDEALVKVENEKLLSDLLGVRKHFKDRLAEAAEQE